MNRKNGYGFVLFVLLVVGCVYKVLDMIVLEIVYVVLLEFSVYGEGELCVVKFIVLLVFGLMWML